MFMSAMYTESLFAFLSFLGMRLLYEGRSWSAAFVWSLSSFTRSNGITYVGFFVYELLIKGINKIHAKVNKLITLSKKVFYIKLKIV